LYDIKGYAVKSENAYKQSKYFWFDSGSACFLAGIRRAEDLKNPSVKGRYFENFILQQILSWASLQLTAPEIFYWKQKAGDSEVDFVVRHAGKAVGIEVKSSENITFGDTRSMRNFLKFHPEVSRGIVVYNGQRVYPAASNIYAVPWTML
jgi:predicted AAA+ superfamily ATPase